MFAMIIRSLFVAAAKRYVASSKTTFDDKLLAAVEMALQNKDYGLQRKPTGPRANKRTGNGKATKKA